MDGNRTNTNRTYRALLTLSRQGALEVVAIRLDAVIRKI
jgi:hypothetical protein